MKRLSLISVWIFIVISIFAQAPQGFKYQAVLRDANGNPLESQKVKIIVSILQSGVSGTEVYSETYDISTNPFGIVNLNIGQGNVTSGDFSAIDWAKGPYFIKLNVDGTDMGASQILSVPFALYAEKAGNSFSGNYNDLNNKPALFDGNYSSLSNKPNIKDTVTAYGFNGNYNDLSNKPALFNGQYSSLSGAPSLSTVATSGNYIDLTNKPDFTKWDKDSTDNLTKPSVAASGDILSYDGSNWIAKANTGSSFSGNYNDLTNKPVFTKWDKDSTDNITKPTDVSEGDLLYYDGNNWIAKRIFNGTTGYTGGSQSFSIRDPYLGIAYLIATEGIYPSRKMTYESYLGSIGIFAGNFDPMGWEYCNGQILSIPANTALFSLLGTIYGGNGTTTFALPDLRGRTPIHIGQGTGLTNNITIGQKGGTETQTLIINNLPSHNHTITFD